MMRPVSEEPTIASLAMRLRQQIAPGGPGQAAVAAILREEAGKLEALLMRRAANPRDPWSGDTCLPGGHWSKGDASLLETAVRETREEVGLDLSRSARLLGTLEPVRPFGVLSRMRIQPFVFALEREATFTLGSEAVETFWLPLDAAASGALDDRHLGRIGPFAIHFDCWRHEGQVVWGLTLGFLKSLLES
jgi:8-oxo-dGTP pyrophosphatase MutT (NUDIX family)